MVLCVSSRVLSIADRSSRVCTLLFRIVHQDFSLVERVCWVLFFFLVLSRHVFCYFLALSAAILAELRLKRGVYSIAGME